MGMDAVDVWAADVDSGRFDGSVCNAAEHARAASFGDRRGGARWLAARHFLRVVLSRRLEVPPAALVFELGPHGKPTTPSTSGTSRTSGTSGTEFNLAHSGGIAVVALATRPVGVDVEVHRTVARPEGVARRLGVAWPVTDEQLLRAWCRTEALVKATGDGATRGLARVEERLGREGWRVADLVMGDGLHSAVAAHGDDWVVVGPIWA